MGGGVAFFDYDSDGDPDLLLLHSDAEADPPVVLYANDGKGHFSDVTSSTHLDEAVGRGFLGMGVAVADVDGDGWRDLYLTAVGGNRLLWNRRGRFVDGTAAAGVAGPPDAWSTGAAFFDADGDGDLDLFVTNYLQWSRALDDARDFQLDGIGRAYGLPQDYAGTDSLLFANRGDGTFEEVGAKAGIRVAAADGEGSAPVGKGLAVAIEDVDGDGRPDVFVANDTSRNFLFHNEGGGRFAEQGELFGVAYSPDGHNTGAMGVDFGDLAGDGRLAVAVGNFAKETSSLYRAGDEPGFFVDSALGAGLGSTRMPLTFGVLLVDADLDGRLDLLQVNGHVEPDIATADPSQSYRQPPQLFWNAGPGPGGRPRFVELPAAAVGDLATPIAGRGAAYADIDGDGDLDLAITQAGGPLRLLRNDQQHRPPLAPPRPRGPRPQPRRPRRPRHPHRTQRPPTPHPPTHPRLPLPLRIHPHLRPRRRQETRLPHHHLAGRQPTDPLRPRARPPPRDRKKTDQQGEVKLREAARESRSLLRGRGRSPYPRRSRSAAPPSTPGWTHRRR